MNLIIQFNKFYLLLDSFSNKIIKIPYWKYYYTFNVTLFCIVTTVPSLKNIGKNHIDTITYQINNPFKQIPEKYTAQNEKEFDGSKSHLDKLAFRFMAPLIGNIFRLNYHQLVYLQMFLFSFFYFFLLRFFENNNFSKTLLILSPLIFATTFIGKWGIIDVWYFDGFAYLFILIAICRYSIPITFITALAACFFDERVIISLLIVLFFYNRFEDSKNKYYLNKYSLTILFVLFSYFIIRLFLKWNFGLLTNQSAIGSVAFNYNIQFIPISTFAFIECAIFLLFIALFFLKNKSNFDLIIFIILSSIVVLVSNLVFDVSRSLGFGFPLILISLVVISKYLSKVHLEKILILIVFSNLLIPAYSFCVNFTLLKPIYFDKINNLITLALKTLFI